MNEKFSDLGSPRRVWAVASPHGDVERLSSLHDYIALRFHVRDRLIYLGNYLGLSKGRADGTIDELLAFRAALLAKPGVEPTDLVYLRGPAEESWMRLLRLQFTPVPSDSFQRYMASGVETYLRHYGVSINDSKTIVRAGNLAITRWTNQLRDLQRKTPGHEKLFASMRRAAYSQSPSDSKKVLYVPSGFDSGLSLDEQGDHLWWENQIFETTGKALSSYHRIIRGHSPTNEGCHFTKHTVTLDSGAGRGGALVCGSFNAGGQLLELLTVDETGFVQSETKERPAANDRFYPVASLRHSMSVDLAYRTTAVG